MNCPTCNSAMVAEPAFLSVSWSCPACARGEVPARGYVILNMHQACKIAATGRREMVFRDDKAAAATVRRMGRDENFLYEVLLESEPAWHPRKLRPDEEVAWCLIRWDAKRNGLVGRQEKGA